MVKDSVHDILFSLQKEFKVFKSDMYEVKKDIKEMKATLNQHSSALLSIKSTLKFYGDMYKANTDAIKNLDQRVTVLERV
jgi:hypothetical protein